MQPVKINDKLFVMGQPSPADFDVLAGQGVATIINNRPDGEDAAQPGTAAEQSAALAAGLAYAHVPVTLGSISTDDVRAFQDALSKSEGPVLAHCKSGTRALSLHVIGEVLDGRLRDDDVRDFGAIHGFDLSGAEAWLNANRNGS